MTQHSTQNQSVRELARREGLLRARDLEGAGISRVVLARMTASGELEKVARGLYRLANSQFSEFESLATVARRVPQAVFCLLTALQIHGLTTQSPRQIWIAMPHGSHPPRIDYPPIRMVQATGAAFAEGIVTIKRDKVLLRVYSVEKTIADCFKHRSKIGLDVALEALREARVRRGFKADELWRHAQHCRVTNVIRPYMEALQ